MALTAAKSLDMALSTHSTLAHSPAASRSPSPVAPSRQPSSTSSVSQHRPAFHYTYTDYGGPQAGPSLSASTAGVPHARAASPSARYSYASQASAPLAATSEKTGGHDGLAPVYHVQYVQPVRHLYDRRRSPTRLDMSRDVPWRDRLCGSKDGGIGRAIITGWVVTTLAFIAATAFWKGQLFAALDDMSEALHEMGFQGQLVAGVLIFITTIPPLPLYSTLIVLSGYTFGTFRGFVTSYLASLSGAVIVFILSRTYLRDSVTKSLQSSATATSLLQILPQRPHLLLLIRIAPYPYNLLNVILASAPTLSLRTYTACTALSLLKLVVHTWVGAGIHDLSAAYHVDPASDSAGDGGEWTHHSERPSHQPTADEVHRQKVRAWATWIGIGMCVVLFFYLTHLAKKALAKAQEEQRRHSDAEEGVAFLSEHGEDP